MERIFVIPCRYSDKTPFIYRCLDSIRKYYDDKIVIFDSNSDDKSYFDIIKNDYTNVEIIEGNKNYMTGAIWKSYDKFEVNYYYYLHDSTELIDSLLQYEKYSVSPILKSSSWKWPVWPSKSDGTRTSVWAEKELKKTDIEFKKNGFDSIIGPMFIINRNVLDELKRLNFNKILPTQKSEMEMMERIWGLAFNQIGIEFKENVVLKNKSGSSGPLQEVILKNKNNNKELAVPVKMATRDIDDSIIKYWSGRL